MKHVYDVALMVALVIVVILNVVLWLYRAWCPYCTANNERERKSNV